MKGLRRRSEKSGLPPGSPVYVGERRTEKVGLTVIDYNDKTFDVRELDSVAAAAAFRLPTSISWINIDGLHEVPLIEEIGKIFGIHSLIIEDILNTEQRPKMDVHEDYIFLVVKMHTIDPESGEIDVEQVSMIIGDSYLLTFQERPGDIFDPVRVRLRENRGRIRKSGADYLAYALLDTVVDSYFRILESFSDDTEVLEEEVLSEPSSETLGEIHFLKREMAYLRKSVWPLREIINTLKRQESSLVQDATVLYFGDLYDHTIQVIDTLETLKDIVSSVLDIYLSGISNRMNEIMKVLTIFAAIFIPLTFIAGIYGMNFNTAKSPLNMPELNWYFGYPLALGLMAVVAGIMVVYFKKKKWF